MKNAILSLLISTSMAATTWDYKTNGADWPSIDAACKATNQSPIDLKTDWDHVEEDKFDDFNKVYTNQRSNIDIVWNGHTS